MAEPANIDRPILRAVVDFGGLAVFLVVYFVAQMVLKKPTQEAALIATGGLVAGSVLALAAGLIIQRRIAPLPLFGGLAALVFGALTLVYHDPKFIQLKPTVINLALAAVMVGGLIMKKDPLRALSAGALNLTPEGSKRLTLRYAAFFIAMAALNELVAHTVPFGAWVIFRFPGLLVISLLFSASQVPAIMKDMKAMEAAAELEP